MKTPEEKKAAQAAAHKRWRESPKGKDYLLKRKLELSWKRRQEEEQDNAARKDRVADA